MTPARIAAFLVAVLLGLVLGTSADVVYQATRPGAHSLVVATGQSGSGKSATTLPAVPGGGNLTAGQIADRVDPAVVDIYTVLADGSGEAAGTGMVISASGQALTNAHVVSGAATITAQVAGTGRTYAVSVVGSDRADDIAVLQLRGASGLSTIAVGDSSAVGVGDAVVAIGNALGRGGPPAVSQGVVAGLNQTITAIDGGSRETLHGLIQVRALIQPGDSGGPLVDASGQVIGMDTAAQLGGGRRGGGAGNNGFAIPISSAMAIAQQLTGGASSAQAGTPAGGA